jgi:hypothetical protein
MGLGPELGRKSRLFFHAGPERLARSLGPWAFGRMSPMPDTPMGQRLGAVEYELMAMPGRRPEATRAFNLLVPLVGEVLHRAGALARVTVPTLILWGERDETVPVQMGEAASKLMPSARMVRLPVGHSPHLDRPDLVYPTLKAFLDERAPARWNLLIRQQSRSSDRNSPGSVVLKHLLSGTSLFNPNKRNFNHTSTLGAGLLRIHWRLMQPKGVLDEQRR